MSTRGRPPRKRSPIAGDEVEVKPHMRKGRKPGSPDVLVDGYKRATPRLRSA